MGKFVILWIWGNSNKFHHNQPFDQVEMNPILGPFIVLPQGAALILLNISTQMALTISNLSAKTPMEIFLKTWRKILGRDNPGPPPNRNGNIWTKTYAHVRPNSYFSYNIGYWTRQNYVRQLVHRTILEYDEFRVGRGRKTEEKSDFWRWNSLLLEMQRRGSNCIQTESVSGNIFILLTSHTYITVNW